MKKVMCTILKYNYEDEIKNVENAELVEGIGTKRNVCTLFWRNLNKSDHSEDLGVHSFSNLSDDRSKASSKMIPPHSAI